MANRSRGFTLIELITVVAIVGIVAALGASYWSKAKKRTQHTNAALEIQTTMMVARARALSSGRDVAVMFFPLHRANGGGRGRVLALYDGNGGFMDGTGADTFCAWAGAAVDAGPAAVVNVGPLANSRNEVLGAVDLPVGVVVGAPTITPGAAFPFTTVPAPGSTGCSFCATVGARAGAVRFDARGQATFYATCGAPPAAGANGGSVSVIVTDDMGIRGTSLLMILPSGLVRSFYGG